MWRAFCALFRGHPKKSPLLVKGLRRINSLHKGYEVCELHLQLLEFRVVETLTNSSCIIACQDHDKTHEYPLAVVSGRRKNSATEA